jgi:hypothetical protein
MKISTNQNLHLTYCTNVHPGESWKQVFTNLVQFIPPLKAQLSPKAPFGIGLRLADVAAQELLTGDALKQFQSWLSQHNLYVFTLNGFPYGGFHRQVVKDQVYAPDWSRRSRLDYTVRLIAILATLLPEGMEGGISTVPLSYKPWWQTDDAARATIFSRSAHHLAQLTQELIRVKATTGKCLHIDLEPEPDGLIENTAEVIEFFQSWLLPVGGDYLTQTLGISRSQAELKLLEHIRLCYDTCHFAVAYEDPTSAFTQLQAAGIQIGKLQLSAALQVRLPDQVEQRRLIAEQLQRFAEPTYLHQVVERRSNNTLFHYSDLSSALPHLERSSAQEWRTHFHVPIFVRDYTLLQSTQDHLLAVLHLLQHQPLCQHLEIETYTWEVLPPSLKLDLSASIAREYEWVLAAFELENPCAQPQPSPF